MPKDADVIRTYFAKLGLETEIADIYLALHAYGPQSISALSRNSGVERTRIYRLIDSLMESNLVEVETRYKRGIIHAAPISNLNILISKREQELRGLQDELSLIEQVLGRNSLTSPATRVQSYQGPEGVKQMLWNQATSKASQQVSILYENMQIQTGQAFFERWVQTCNARGMKCRSVIGDDFLRSQKLWQAKHETERLTHWESRYVSQEFFPIKHSTVIYDNVTSQYNWKDGEIFGVEIYNQEVADMQRQLYELLWKSAAPKDGAKHIR
jgi:sugar-specific transcriptional regulator TrmB